MSNARINVDDYVEYGFGDLYYGLITFISKYVEENYDLMEYFQNGSSKYAIALTTMKSGLKELLEYFKTVNEIYLPALNKNVRLDTLTVVEYLALEERCKEFLIIRVNEALNDTLEEKVSPKTK